MPRPIAFLLFLIVEVALLPMSIVGMLLFGISYFVAIRGKSVSKTAYYSIFGRWLLHTQGKRRDEATEQLWLNLPGISPIPAWLAFKPTVWAMRVSGFAFNMHNYPVRSSSSCLESMGHRTTFLDTVMLHCLDQVEQIVILGAGWDTRAYCPALERRVRVFEVDTKEMQAHKRNSLAKASIESEDVIFAAANLSKECWLDVLKGQGFEPAKPTLVLLEGVTYYLKAEALEATLQTVATRMARGSAIAFNYAAKHIVDGNGSPVMRLVLELVRHLGEPWIFGISTEHLAMEQLASILGRNSLELAEYEPIGKGAEHRTVDGGLVLAVNHKECWLAAREQRRTSRRGEDRCKGRSSLKAMRPAKGTLLDST